MANVGSLGGINIQFGADIGDLNRALRGMEDEVQSFVKRLGSVALEGVIKGDPFSATTKYMREAGKQLNTAFKTWENGLDGFDHKMGRVAERAKVNAAKITNAISTQAKQASKELEMLQMMYQQATQSLNVKDMGIAKGSDSRVADMRKVYSKQFRETLNLFKGFNADVNVILDDLINKSRSKSGLSAEAITKSIKKIDALLNKDKANLQDLVPKSTIDTVKQLVAELQKVFKVQKQLEQVSKVRTADADAAAKDRRIDKLKAIRAEEKQLLADQRQGVNVNKELVALYERKLRLGVSLTKTQQARMPQAEAPITADDKRLEKLRGIRAQEKDLLAEQRLGIDVNKRLVALYEKKLSLGVRLTKAQQARRFDTGEKQMVNEMNQLVASIRETVNEKKRGQDVDEKLTALIERRVALQERINKAQRLRSPAAKGSYGAEEQQKLIKLKEIDAMEKKLLAQAANGVNVEKELVALYQRKLSLGEALTRHQQSRMPNAEKEKAAILKDIRNQEQSLLGLRRAGLNVDQELLSLYKKIESIGQTLTEGQKQRANEIQRVLTLERNLAKESKKTAKVKGEIVQIGKNTVEETKRGLRLEELITKESKKQEQIEKRQEARAKRTRANMVASRAEAIKLERAVSGKGERKGTKEFDSERELMASVRAEEKLAKAKKMKTEYERSGLGITRRAEKAAEEHRNAIKGLNAEIKHNYKVESNRAQIIRRLTAIQETGIRLSVRERKELAKLTLAQKKATKATEGRSIASSFNTLFAPSRMLWFVQLRTFWAAYQSIGAAARDVVEAHTQLSRALRTARSEFKTTEQVASLYHQAMKDVVRIHGVGWEEAGEVLYQLGSAGLSAEESLSALHSTMSLIVAVEGEARDTTKAVAGIYNNFGETLKDLNNPMEKFAYITDLVATAWSEHQVEISELTAGYNQAIAMTKAAGLGLKELTALLAVANDHMIKGGRAGRALQNVYMRIARTPNAFARAFGLTDDDFDPNKPLDFIAIMDKLSMKMREGSLSVNELSRNFERLGLRGAPVFTMYLQNWEKVQNAIERYSDVSGKASEIEEIRLDNLASVWDRFLGTLKAALQGVTPVVDILKNSLADLINVLGEGTALQLAKGLLSGEKAPNDSSLIVLEQSLDMMEDRMTKVGDLYKKVRAEIVSKPIMVNGRMVFPSDMEIDAMVEEQVESLIRANQYYRKRGMNVGFGSDKEKVAEVLDMPTVADLNLYTTNFKIISDAAVKLREDLKMPAREKTADVIATQSDYISQYEKNMRRYLVTRGLIDAPVEDMRAYVEAGVKEAFTTYAEVVSAYDWSPIDLDIQFNLDALAKSKDVLDDVLLGGVLEEQISPFNNAIENEGAAKRMLFFRTAILDIDREIKELNDDIINDTTKAMATLQLTTDEANRTATFKQMEGWEIARINKLEGQRKGYATDIKNIVKEELDSVYLQLRARKRTLDATAKELDIKNLQSRTLGVSAEEEEEMLANIKKRLAVTAAINRTQYALGLHSGTLKKDALEELKIKQDTADETAREAAILKIITIRRSRLTAILREYKIELKKINDIYNEAKTTNEINIATRKEELSLTKKRNDALLKIHTRTLQGIKVRRKYIRNAEAQVALMQQEETLQNNINKTRNENRLLDNELHKQSSVLYDLWTRLEERSKDINTIWHDIADTFMMGMVQGVAEMWTDWISGSQEAQQEVINLESAIEGLEQQADAIKEKGIFSYEEAQNLQNINAEIAEMNDEISDLEDPIEQAKEQFKTFFKSLIDEINLVIARLIIMRILSGVMGAYTGGDSAGPIHVGAGGTTAYGMATGGVTNRIKAFKTFSKGGVTGNPMMAILGDNPSGKELVIPAENIARDGVSGYAQEAKQPINVVNVLSKEDIAAAMASKEGERVVVNLIGRDLNNGGPIARRLNI